MGTVTIPSTVTGTGLAYVTFSSTTPSHTFHVISTGDNPNMMVIVTGTKVRNDGKMLYAYIVHEENLAGGIDKTKTLDDLPPDNYTVEILTANLSAPWSVEIT